jgi:hypothetical protein
VIELESGISNSGKYLDTNQSYISIPIVTTLYAVMVISKTNLRNAFAVSKNGYTSLIFIIADWNAQIIRLLLCGIQMY